MAQPTHVGSACAAATSIAIPAHQVGDLIVIAAYRDGATTIPTKPIASGTVPAWVTIDGPTGSNLNSAIVCQFVATATTTTSGTWTNATGMAVSVWRGQNTTTPIGSHSIGFGAAATGAALLVSALTTPAPVTDGTSVFLTIVGWRTVTAWTTPPSAGYTQQAQVATETEVVTKDSTTSDGAYFVAGTASASGGYAAMQVEVLAPVVVLPPPIVNVMAAVQQAGVW